MGKTVVLDEFHVTVRVPADLPDADVDVARAVLDGDEFSARLVRAVRAVLAGFPELLACRVSIDR